MANYELSQDAECDLREVAVYTKKTFGPAKLKEYKAGLERKFSELKDALFQRKFSNQFPELLVAKYQRHFIFYFFNDEEIPVIIAVIHEERNIVNCLHERLE